MLPSLAFETSTMEDVTRGVKTDKLAAKDTLSTIDSSLTHCRARQPIHAPKSAFSCAKSACRVYIMCPAS